MVTFQGNHQNCKYHSDLHCPPLSLAQVVLSVKVGVLSEGEVEGALLNKNVQISKTLHDFSVICYLSSTEANCLTERPVRL